MLKLKNVIKQIKKQKTAKACQQRKNNCLFDIYTVQKNTKQRVTPKWVKKSIHIMNTQKQTQKGG